MKKTIKLHWKEATSSYITPKGQKTDTIWLKMTKELGSIKVDSEKVEQLFASKTVELKTKKQETNKKEIAVLEAKRSNVINIGLTALPPPRTIKTAIMKMDNAIMNREAIEKVLTTMVPTDEEKKRIEEAQKATSDLPLGKAEQFLATLLTVANLTERLKLWLFKMDFDTIENEIGECLLDLKLGMEELRKSKSLRQILASVLSVGNFLNGSEVKGFIIEYLAKISEVKDTIHKHSLLYYLGNIILDQFHEPADLYSEIGSINRCAKVEWDEMVGRLGRLETDVKSCWEDLDKIIADDPSASNKNKLSDYLTACAGKIVVLKVILKRLMNRFRKFLLYLGYSADAAKEVNVTQFCKAISEFSLEYRTMREKLMAGRMKKMKEKERKKTRGKMIVETDKFASKSRTLPLERQRDDDLKMLLDKNHYSTSLLQPTMDNKARKKSLLGSVDRNRSTDNIKGGKHSSGHASESEGMDDMLEVVVRSAARSSATDPKNAQRIKTSERKSWRSTNYR